MSLRKYTIEQEKAVVCLFPNHTKKEIMDATGVSDTFVDRTQAKYHLRKSPEHKSNVGRIGGNASQIARGGKFINCYTPQVIAKRVETYKKTYRLEDARVRWGLEQRTKIHLKHGNKELWNQSSYLRHLGYILDEKNKVAYYTEETHRATRLEKYKRGTRGKYIHCYYDFRPYGTVED